MKETKLLLLLILIAAFLFIAVALLTACTHSNTMTVKFTEDGCTYDGPKSISYGKFTVKWVVDDQKHNKTGLVILTLDAGKTIDDLKAYHCEEAPLWANILWIGDENAFGSELEKTRTYIHEYNLKNSTSYHGDPLYMVCGNEEHKTGALGPIEVTK